MTDDWQQGGFGIYLHWPFCEAKCPYCDFNSHVRANIDQSSWNRAYISEIDHYADLLPDRVVNSVFIGGGTPSLMDPETVADILDHIRKRWPTANDLEVTLEANPSSVEAGRFAAYAEGGVSRVSLGVQALNEIDLKRLGRLHTVHEARQAYDIARKYFTRVSFDLIYARQDQSLDDWRSELTEALAMAVDHLSLYQLTVEPGTVFAQRFDRGGLRGLPSEDLSADMYTLTQELCETAGYAAYEVSNHAKPSAESRHNLIYWRYGDYVGIGPGAHGRITMKGQRHETAAFSNPEKWLSQPTGMERLKTFAPIAREEQATELVLMGLRLQDGIDLRRYAALKGSDMPKERLDDLQDMGLVTVKGDQLCATAKGRLVLNTLISTLLDD